MDKTASVRVLQDQDHILLVFDGKTMSRIPWEKAASVAKAISSVAKLAEEYAKVFQVAEDQAILMRTGAPVGIVMQPKVMEEAKKMSMYDRDLRRYIPHVPHLESSSMVYAPTIKQTPPVKTPQVESSSEIYTPTVKGGSKC